MLYLDFKFIRTIQDVGACYIRNVLQILAQCEKNCWDFPPMLSASEFANAANERFLPNAKAFYQALGDLSDSKGAYKSQHVMGKIGADIPLDLIPRTRFYLT